MLSVVLSYAELNDECGPTIVINADLPNDPAIFTMAHELKHHLADGGSKLSFCARANELEPIEIGQKSSPRS